ncbi:hypothetical protein GDO81_008435 [Engystomops pustulosus]|uniref:Uncharacterized protein n=1 Tax=Engystomops pustulosus TaxID=76066 RepID=A0AAV7CGC3_ENGPU|nr:hypothetical protein GDO81_008435 [Engystomops pustulosus]
MCRPSLTTPGRYGESPSVPHIINLLPSLPFPYIPPSNTYLFIPLRLDTRQHYSATYPAGESSPSCRYPLSHDILYTKLDYSFISVTLHTIYSFIPLLIV